MFGPKTLALQKRAREIMPLGVNSNFRFWGDEITPYVEKAKGAYLWDVDGTKYIDYRLAFGPIILGHSYDEVDRKVIEEIQKGILFAMTSELEVSVAEMIIEMAPAVEMVRFACSGTEATMHAIRVARAYTGRDLTSSSRAITTASTITRSGPPTHRWKPTATVATPSLCPERPGFPRRCVSS